MKLSIYDEAVVPEAKVRRYLLNETHPVGQHNALFFRRFGFSPDRWEQLRVALLEHAASHEVVSTLETGKSIVVVPVSPSQVRQIGSREVAHVRMLEE